jgi:hypothetical protein
VCWMFLDPITPLEAHSRQHDPNLIAK